MTHHIRPAKTEDGHLLVPLARQMHAESDRRDTPFDARLLFTELALHTSSTDHWGVLAFDGVQPIGFCFGRVRTFALMRGRLAASTFIYVLPAYRGTRVFLRMLERLEQWATAIDADGVLVGMSGGVNCRRMDKLFDILGYEQIGDIYAWRSHCEPRTRASTNDIYLSSASRHPFGASAFNDDFFRFIQATALRNFGSDPQEIQRALINQATTGDFPCVVVEGDEVVGSLLLTRARHPFNESYFLRVTYQMLDNLDGREAAYRQLILALDGVKRAGNGTQLIVVNYAGSPGISMSSLNVEGEFRLLGAQYLKR